jgi:hypothetical protein
MNGLVQTANDQTPIQAYYGPDLVADPTWYASPAITHQAPTSTSATTSTTYSTPVSATAYTSGAASTPQHQYRPRTAEMEQALAAQARGRTAILQIARQYHQGIPENHQFGLGADPRFDEEIVRALKEAERYILGLQNFALAMRGTAGREATEKQALRGMIGTLVTENQALHVMAERQVAVNNALLVTGERQATDIQALQGMVGRLATEHQGVEQELKKECQEAKKGETWELKSKIRDLEEENLEKDAENRDLYGDVQMLAVSVTSVPPYEFCLLC